MRRRSYFFLILFSVCASANFVSANWNNPNGVAPSFQALAPITVSLYPPIQYKQGGLALGGSTKAGILSVFGTSQKFFVDGRLLIGPGFAGDDDNDGTLNWKDPDNSYYFPSNDPARIDVDGSLRIRGGSPEVNSVLVSDALGRATWSATGGATNLSGQNGIFVSRNPASGAVTISAETNDSSNHAQQRVAGQCAGSESQEAITAISRTGAVTCRPFVTTVVTPSGSGLSGAPTPTSGPINLSINLGGSSNKGVWLDSVDNKLKLRVDSVNSGDGLTVDSSGYLRFEDCNDLKPYWKWNNSLQKWECDTIPVSSSTPDPGNSVILLKDKSGSIPPACPSNWSEAPQGSGLSYTYNEEVGAVTSKQNAVRVCFRTDRSCQVMYFRSTTTPLPSCISGYSAITPDSSEWSPGGGFTNNVRVCYSCY